MLSFGANKNKKNIQYASVLLLLILVGGVAFPHPVHAVDILGMFGDGVAGVFKSLLWGVFSMVGGLLSGAVTIFQYAVDPAVYGPTGLFNKASVYNMWKLIRDFLNLFFILTLLYTAFTIVFQIASNYKKTLLSIVLAALFVNFSFPLTRVIIDATNVPMYYFINLILDSGKSNPNLPIAVGQGALGPALAASGLKDILIPPQNSLSSETITVAQLLMAIVFLFVFMVTLMVLAVMFVIRMMALLLLVIFSPIGFAASIIPGLKQYSAKWWDKLWQYAFFGPAAMLMLYIATQFFEEIAKDDTKMNMKLATQNNIASTGSDFFASMGMYSITIIMLWMAIGLANSMSIAGAGAVAGTGEKFLKWAGRKTYNNPVGRGLGVGVKDRFQGTRVGRWLKSPSGTEAAIKGWTKKTGKNPFGQAGRAGARTELQKLKDKQIYEQISKDKENKLSRTDALARLNSNDDIMRISAATSLANMDNGIQSMDDLTKALDALKDPTSGTMNPAYAEKAVEIVAKADKKIIADNPATGTTGLQNLQTVIGSLGNNEKAITDLISKLDDSAFSGSGAQYDQLNTTLSATGIPSLVATLKRKAIKEGAGHILTEDLVNRGVAPDVAVGTVLGDIKSAKDIVNSVKLFTDPRFSAAASSYVVSLRASSPDRYQEIKKAAAQESPEVASHI